MEELKALLEGSYASGRWKAWFHEHLQAEFYAYPESLEVERMVAKEAWLTGFIPLKYGQQLTIFEVLLQPHIEVERSRTKLRNLLRAYWQNADAALIVFYSETNATWRLSLVTETLRLDTEGSFYLYRTPPRRFTYLLGHERIHTPLKRFIELIQVSKPLEIQDFLNAFSTDTLNKEFYSEIQQWFFEALGQAKFPNDMGYEPTAYQAQSLIRLLTRVVFIWFLKHKQLVNPLLFDKERLYEIVKDFGKSHHYYNAILQNLFFATLNQPIEHRSFAQEGGFATQKQHYGVKNLYRYKDLFLLENEDDIISLFNQTPFLNGGLFDCLDWYDSSGRTIYQDGFSRNAKKRAQLSDGLFFNFSRGRHESTRGLIEILHSYHFTVEESTPIEQDVALDPELLGRIFENLLAVYNPETSATARKATGSYYTPREVVDYMTTESLVAYFSKRLASKGMADLEARLRLLFRYTDAPNPFDDVETEKLVAAIDGLKIFDPACGSGAFPMGILNILVHALQKLDPSNRLWKARQEEKAMEDTHHAFHHIADKERREEILREINDRFDEAIHYPDYARKLYLIENCIYGADIQQIAIQITKLRCFITIILDQKVDVHQANYGIRSLPNLETQFMVANTLKKLEQPLLAPEEVYNLLEQLRGLRHRYFTAKSRKEKLELQSIDREMRASISKLLLKAELPPSYADAVASFDPYHPNASTDWFSAFWMYGLTTGFDIVIGNPPYIQLQKEQGKLAKQYEGCNFKTFARTGDIYCLFYEQGITLLGDEGVLALITSNKWMRAGYGEKLREYLSKFSLLQLLDLGPQVFEQATVDTNILILRKSKEKIPLRAVTIQQKKKSGIDFYRLLSSEGVTLQNLGKAAWFIGSEKEQRLKAKIERMGKPLKHWDVKIYYGIKTGLNEAFIIDTDKRNEILANCKDEDERKRTEAIIKPILRGRDIKRYYYEWAGLWVIFIPWHFPLHNDLSIQGASEKAEKEFRNQYPSVYSHLLQFKKELSTRNKEETGIRYEWYVLQRCAATYYPEFDKEKIIYPNMTKFLPFVYDDTKIYANPKCYILTGQNLKYLLGIFNSKICSKWIKENCPELQGGTREIQSRVFLNYRIPPITPANEPIVKQIEALVDKILEAKKQDKNKDTSAWERELDRLVYELYDLTDEEIALVEG